MLPDAGEEATAIKEERMRARWGKRAFGLTLVGGLATAAAAVAATVQISGTTLTSNGGTANWDPTTGTDACRSANAYSPVDDGNITSPRSASDAFDDGLVVFVGTKFGLAAFDQPNNKGDLKGQTLKVGPQFAGPLVVSRTDSGLPGSPTLRDLVTLRNPNPKPFKGSLVVDTNLGSDTSTVVVGTSSGDTTVTTADRWTVTADSPTAPSDPPVTLVYYGKGKVLAKPIKLMKIPGSGKSKDCATTRFNLSLPAHSTRYMLFFAEMHSDNPSALSSAKKFNKKHLSSALLKGISRKDQKDVLNWDLG
jgi:hypothetical protein